MVQLDPNIQFIAYVRLSIVRGQSLKNCLTEYCKQHRGVLARHLARLIIDHQQNKATYGFLDTISNERRIVLDIIWRGLKGESIYHHLPDIETELEIRSYERLNAFIQRLPLKVMFVAMVFHFPALLILSFLPLLDQLKEVLK